MERPHILNLHTCDEYHFPPEGKLAELRLTQQHQRESFMSVLQEAPTLIPKSRAPNLSPPECYQHHKQSIYIYTHMHVYIYVYIFVYLINVCIYNCVCIHIHIWIYIYVCVCMYYIYGNCVDSCICHESPMNSPETHTTHQALMCYQHRCRE